MKVLKRTWADISLDNLEHNYRTLREHVGKGPRFLGVVKADSYGHGAVQVSRTLEELGAEYLAVSNLEEAIQLRRGGVGLPQFSTARSLSMLPIWCPQKLPACIRVSRTLL